MSDDREDVAAELRRVAEEARRRALRNGDASSAPSVPPALREPQPLPKAAEPSPEPLPPPPDASAVNAGWRAEAPPPRGPAGLVRRLLERLLRPRLEAQRALNARLVQLHNETLRYLEERFAATHRHYDRVLGLYGRRLDEVDERHVLLQKELVAHVQDLVRRIDLVLAEGDRGRLALEFALQDARARLARLEEALRRDR